MVVDGSKQLCTCN